MNGGIIAQDTVEVQRAIGRQGDGTAAQGGFADGQSLGQRIQALQGGVIKP